MHPGIRRSRVVTAALIMCATLAACGGDDRAFRPAASSQVGQNTGTGTVPVTFPSTSSEPVAPPPPLSQVTAVKVRLEQIPGTEKLDLLTSTATRPSDGTIYFGHQDGRVSKLSVDGTVTQVLDITADVEKYQQGSERGFLGLAVSPDNSRLFTYFTDKAFDSNLRSYALDAAGNIDPATRLDVLFVDQPGLGHKGGGMVFLPDGSLLLALGDGGGSRGRDAQDYTKLLGGIVRVIPNMDSDGYTIPADNPYVGNKDGWPEEIWAKGLRNPWGFNFDAPTGELWLGDVGEKDWEEFNTFPWTSGGLNFGWYYIEGNNVRYAGAPSDARPPTFAYAHSDLGPAVIGGFVYRGSALPGLDGAYIFGDMIGGVYVYADGNAHKLTAHRSVITAWGRDREGEPLLLTQHTGAYRLVPNG